MLKRTFSIGRYNCVERLGSDPLGETFRAKLYGMAGVEDQFVVKRIYPHVAEDPWLMERISASAERYAALHGPGVPRLVERGQKGSVHYLVFARAPGSDLRPFRDVLRRSFPQWGRDAVAQVVARLGERVCEVLGRAHARGVLHQGLCPRTVLLGPKGEVSLLDTGFLRAQEPEERGALGWLVPYLAPEVLRGEPGSERSDVFSVGAVLFELLTGVPPAGPKGTTQSSGVLPLPPLPGVDPETEALGQVLQRALTPRAADRYATAAEISSALRAVAGPHHEAASERLAQFGRQLARSRRGPDQKDLDRRPIAPGDAAGGADPLPPPPAESALPHPFQPSGEMLRPVDDQQEAELAGTGASASAISEPGARAFRGIVAAVEEDEHTIPVAHSPKSRIRIIEADAPGSGVGLLANVREPPDVTPLPSALPGLGSVPSTEVTVVPGAAATPVASAPDLLRQPTADMWAVSELDDSGPTVLADLPRVPDGPRVRTGGAAPAPRREPTPPPRREPTPLPRPEPAPGPRPASAAAPAASPRTSAVRVFPGRAAATGRTDPNARLDASRPDGFAKFDEPTALADYAGSAELSALVGLSSRDSGGAIKAAPAPQAETEWARLADSYAPLITAPVPRIAEEELDQSGEARPAEQGAPPAGSRLRAGGGGEGGGAKAPPPLKAAAPHPSGQRLPLPPIEHAVPPVEQGPPPPEHLAPPAGPPSFSLGQEEGPSQPHGPERAPAPGPAAPVSVAPALGTPAAEPSSAELEIWVPPDEVAPLPLPSTQSAPSTDSVLPPPRPRARVAWMVGLMGLLVIAGGGVALYKARMGKHPPVPVPPAAQPAQLQPPQLQPPQATPPAQPPGPQPTPPAQPPGPQPTPPAPPVPTPPPEAVPPAPAPQAQPAPPAPSAQKPEEAPDTEAEAPGPIAISSTPSAAYIFIDGKLLGRTPATPRLGPGVHRLVLLMEKKKLWRQEIVDREPIHAKMEPALLPPGVGGTEGLKVRCATKGQRIFVDGQDTGVNCPSDRLNVSAGSHKLEFYRFATGQTRDMQVTVKKGKNVSTRVYAKF